MKTVFLLAIAQAILALVFAFSPHPDFQLGARIGPIAFTAVLATPLVALVAHVVKGPKSPSVWIRALAEAIFLVVTAAMALYGALELRVSLGLPL